MMTYAEALTILGLTPADAITVDAVRAAFRRRVKLAHPDSGTINIHSGTLIAKLIMARETVLKGENTVCEKCGGSGTVRVMGTLRLCDCKGE